MTPDDFKQIDRWANAPIFVIHHPEDNAFTAEVRCNGFVWLWHVNGRVGIYDVGSTNRKRKAMWKAIHSLNDYSNQCQSK